MTTTRGESFKRIREIKERRAATDTQTTAEKTFDRKVIASAKRRDRQAAKLGSLIDAAAKLSVRIRLESTGFDLPVADKMREAAMLTYGVQIMLEEARRRFSLRSGLSARGIDYRRDEV